MDLDFDMFKKHPYAWGAAGIGLLVVLWYYMDHSGGSGTAAPVSGGPSAADLAYQEQVNQLNAANNQTSVAAGVAEQQTAAALSAAQNTNATQLGIVQSNNATQLGITQATVGAQENDYNTLASVLTAQLNDQASTQQDQQNDQLAAVESQFNYLGNVAQIQGAVTNNEINTSGQVASQVAANQYALSSSLLGTINAAGLNHGTTALEQSLVGAAETAVGSQAGGVANAYASGQVGSANAWKDASIANSISNAASNIIPGMF
ncbi:MAG: hypothetical protein ACP5EP_12295 [Acidobacteriaceae bacterium]